MKVIKRNTVVTLTAWLGVGLAFYGASILHTFNPDPVIRFGNWLCLLAVVIGLLKAARIETADREKEML